MKAVDFSGNASGFTSGVSATTTSIEDADFENGVRQLFIDQGLDIIEPVSSLPVAGDFVNQQVFLTTEGKLYNWDGTNWVPVIAEIESLDFSELTGTLADAQVAVNAINGTKITDDTITSNEIAARTIQAGNIATGTISANEIAALTITGDKIAANAISSDKITANTITANEIAANTITGGLLATSGIITDSAQINDGLITNAKIGNAAITNAKIGTAEVSTLKLQGESVTISTFYQGSRTFVNRYAFKAENYTVNMPTSGTVQVVCQFYQFGYADENDNCTPVLKINGTQVQGSTLRGANGTHVLIGSLNTGSGNITLRGEFTGGNFTGDVQISFLVLRRFR